jgi:hypothetical protein
MSSRAPCVGANLRSARGGGAETDYLGDAVLTTPARVDLRSTPPSRPGHADRRRASLGMGCDDGIRHPLPAGMFPRAPDVGADLRAGDSIGRTLPLSSWPGLTRPSIVPSGTTTCEYRGWPGLRPAMTTGEVGVRASHALRSARGGAVEIDYSGNALLTAPGGVDPRATPTNPPGHADPCRGSLGMGCDGAIQTPRRSVSAGWVVRVANRLRIPVGMGSMGDFQNPPGAGCPALRFPAIVTSRTVRRRRA